jgi:hypothetical protein
MTNRIFTKGFWNQQKIILKGFGRWLTLGGSGRPKDISLELPAHKELFFEVRAPVEVIKKESYSLKSPTLFQKTAEFDVNSSVKKIDYHQFDINSAVLFKKRLNIPLFQRLGHKKLIDSLIAI